MAFVGPVLEGLAIAGSVLGTANLAIDTANGIRDLAGKVGSSAKTASKNPSKTNLARLHSDAKKLKTTASSVRQKRRPNGMTRPKRLKR